MLENEIIQTFKAAPGNVLPTYNLSDYMFYRNCFESDPNIVPFQFVVYSNGIDSDSPFKTKHLLENNSSQNVLWFNIYDDTPIVTWRKSITDNEIDELIEKNAEFKKISRKLDILSNNKSKLSEAIKPIIVKKKSTTENVTTTNNSPKKAGPTPYHLFVSKKMKELIKSHHGLPYTQYMQMTANAWRENKQATSNIEELQDAEDDVDDDDVDDVDDVDDDDEEEVPKGTRIIKRPPTNEEILSRLQKTKLSEKLISKLDKTDLEASIKNYINTTVPKLKDQLMAQINDIKLNIKNDLQSKDKINLVLDKMNDKRKMNELELVTHSIYSGHWL